MYYILIIIAFVKTAVKRFVGIIVVRVNVAETYVK